MYGFSNTDVAEFTGSKVSYVKYVVQQLNQEVRYVKGQRTKQNRQELRRFKANVFSLDEMDYGYSGQQKYNYEELSTIEQLIYDKI